MSTAVLLRSLWWPSLVNRVRVQLKRLKQPRYVVATALGLGYWLWFFRGGRFFSEPLPAEARVLFELAACAVLVVVLAGYWMFGSDRGTLRFTEAEIQHLFPAPVSRVQLLNYKLVVSLLTGLIGAAVTTLFFGRRLGTPLFFTLGAWLAFTLVSWHALGASFARARMLERGVARRLLRLLSFVPPLAYLGALGWAISRLPVADLAPERESLQRLAELADQGLLGALLAPIRAVVRVAFASDLATFGSALPIGVAVLGLHYVWVLRSAVRFEEPSLVEAEQRAFRARHRGMGRQRAPVAQRDPFRLVPGARPEVALAWKGLIAGRWAVRLRVTLVLAALGCAGVVAARLIPDLQPEGTRHIQDALGITALVAAAATTLVGPLNLRFDLRDDVVNTDVLRTLPLSGQQLFLGELAGPAVLTTLQQWAWLVLAMVAGTGLLTLGERTALALGAGVLAPAISVVALTVQNALAVLVPSWVQVGPHRPVGPEAAGMRLLLLVGNTIAVGFGLLPAALIAALPTFLLAQVIGLYAVPVGAAIATAAVTAEVWLVSGWLGRAYEQLSDL